MFEIQLKTGEITTSDVVRRYFETIFAAEGSGDSFPVDLDDVWSWAYTLKRNAKRALKRLGFLVGIDYKVVLQKEQNPLGGSPLELVMLSVACTEHLIARKNRPIFEVYRQCRIELTRQAKAAVASSGDDIEAQIDQAPLVQLARKHERMRLELEAVKAAQLIQAQDMVQIQETQIQQLLEIIAVQKQAEVAQATAAGAFDLARKHDVDSHHESGYQALGTYAAQNGFHWTRKMAGVHGHKVAAMCRSRGITIGDIRDEHEGWVHTYPRFIMDEYFESLRRQSHEQNRLPLDWGGSQQDN